MSLFDRLTLRNATHRPPRRPALGLEALEDRTVPSLLGQQLFPSDNPWNQKITNAPVAANSSSIINSLVATYGDGRIHPDFGQDYRSAGDLYGIPYNVVHGNSTPRVHVVIDSYPGESDLRDAPIPTNAVLEGDFQNGPNPDPASRGDSHLLVYDEDNNVGYEFFAASRPSENSNGQWHADQESVWDFKTNTFRTLGWTSADAAGLPILPGLARPDEGLPASQGGQGVINHAIRFTLQNAAVLDQFLYPASHTADPGNNSPATQPPMGARFRLKASVDVSSLNPESRVIAQAMKDYGLILADNGSNFFFGGASYSVDSSNGFALTWDDNDIQDTAHGLKSLTFSDFEVVDLTPAVTGLDVGGGPAGTVVTVTGRNFSGAAGHLQVLFGSAPASSVTVLDDSHLRVVAPAGSGTVDVRVQSGVSDPSDPENVNSPVFGYGTSAVSAADRFTYGASVVAPLEERFVTRAYQDLLRRSPGASEVAMWVGYLYQGATHAQVAALIESSVEYRDLVVQDAYSAFLGRAVESQAVLDMWSGFLAGHTQEEFKSAILGSAEYYQRHGGTPAGFVGGLYQDVLGRAPDAVGLAGWAGAVSAGVPESTVALQVLTSSEAFGVLVTASYRHFLRRDPDPGGLASWTAGLRAGMTDEQFVAALVGSDEYTSLL